MPTLFISDLHLCNERPDKVVLFKRLLEHAAKNADAVYILGDLFEAWAGDDDTTPPHKEIISALTEFTRSGKPLYLMRGNRDFLLGKTFNKNTGVFPIEDPTVIDLYGNKILLMHGDTLCTKDVKYQIYRHVVNNPASINIFLLIPFSFRQKIWHGIRNITRKTTARKSPYIVDVYQPTVEKVMLENNVQILIHGHTHHEGIHEFEMHGKKAMRYVLGDWYNKDSVLIADKNNLQLMRVEEYLKNNQG